MSQRDAASQVKKARASLNSASKGLSFNHLVHVPD